MATLENNTTIEKYKGIVFGARTSDKKPDYFVEDFLDEETLVDFIVSTYDHESMFTKDGFDFIESYYGLDKVIEMVLKKHPDYPFDKGITPKEALQTKKEYAIDIEEDRKTLKK